MNPLHQPWIALCLLTPFAMPQSPRLVRDIHTSPKQNPGSRPAHFTTAGAFTYFVATTVASGTELYRTDGTSNGTRLVKEIRPGPDGAAPTDLTSVGSRLYFTADDGVHGAELWTSDGSEAGTRLVADLVPGLNRVQRPGSLTAYRGQLVFRAPDTKHGSELWITDGTLPGTRLIKDIEPGTASSMPTEIVVWRDVVYFRAANVKNGQELWRSDGSEAGTRLVKDIEPGSRSSQPSEFTAAASRLFFRAETRDHGFELWSTDGTANGTRLVKDIHPGTTHSFPTRLSTAGDRLYFSAATLSNGRELWTSDGTAAGTRLVRDLTPGIASSNFSGGIRFRNRFYFSAFSTTGVGLFATDGSTVTHISDVQGNRFSIVRDTMYFQGHQLSSTRELYKSDGTRSGTVPLTANRAIAHLATTSRGALIFSGREGRTLPTGSEPWISDGSTPGTKQLADVARPQPGTLGSVPREGVRLGSHLYFSAYQLETGVELWRTDGTAAGTELVKDVAPGADNGFHGGLTRLGDRLLYFATDRTHERSIWTSDGTAAGTKLVKPIKSSPIHLPSAQPVVFGGRAFFGFGEQSSGVELWTSDGTATGTFLVKDIAPGTASSSPDRFTVVGDQLFFVAASPGIGRELWRTDGTAAGTTLVKDIRVGFRTSSPTPLGIIRDQLVFSADDATHGSELWITDGTTTRMIVDLVPGPDSSFAGFGTTFFGFVMFAARTNNRVQLWRTDGTARGTTRLLDVVVAPPMAVLGNKLLFFAAGANTGLELWRSNGTTAGTRRIKMLDRVAGATIEGTVSPVGSRRVAFRVFSRTRGLELWLTDGTPDGTARGTDLNPSPIWRASFTRLMNGELYFPRATEATGLELWAWNPGATAQPIGTGCGTAPRTATLSAGDPVLGGQMTVVGNGAAAGSIAILLAGSRPPRSPIGRGCQSYIDFLRPHVILAALATSRADWRVPFAIPNDPALSGVTTVVQAWLARTNPLVIETTNGLVLSFGR